MPLSTSFTALLHFSGSNTLSLQTPKQHFVSLFVMHHTQLTASHHLALHIKKLAVLYGMARFPQAHYPSQLLPCPCKSELLSSPPLSSLIELCQSIPAPAHLHSSLIRLSYISLPTHHISTSNSIFPASNTYPCFLVSTPTPPYKLGRTKQTARITSKFQDSSSFLSDCLLKAGTSGTPIKRLSSKQDALALANSPA